MGEKSWLGTVDYRLNRGLGRASSDTLKKLEATTGFEPVNRGFADPRLNHLATSPLGNVLLERKTRFELATSSLARRRSTAELLPLYHPRKFLIFVGTRLLVPRRRFELLRAYAHHPLKMACLPIPPPRPSLSLFFIFPREAPPTPSPPSPGKSPPKEG